MKSARYRAARFDILDYLPNGRKSNYMDLNSASGYAFLCLNWDCFLTLASLIFSVERSLIEEIVGFVFGKKYLIYMGYNISFFDLRLAILSLLKATMNNFACHFGIKCSSFCKVNIGTSMRSACTALGFTCYTSVCTSNKLLERMGLPKPLVGFSKFNIFSCLYFSTQGMYMMDMKS